MIHGGREGMGTVWCCVVQAKPSESFANTVLVTVGASKQDSD